MPVSRPSPDPAVRVQSRFSSLPRADSSAGPLHIRFLADDLLEGRVPGTNGHRIAARYREAQFRKLGLEPAGEQGGYHQAVPLLRGRTDPERSAMTLITAVGERPLEYGKDFIVSPLFTTDHDEVEGDVVFVGFAIAAPEVDYDDFAGVDLKGKIAVLHGRARLVSAQPAGLLLVRQHEV